MSPPLLFAQQIKSQTLLGIGGDRPMLILYNIARAPTRKPNRIGLPLTHKDG